GVRVWLVAGVDDGPLERRLESDLGLEEVGALRELEHVLAALVPLRLEPELSGTGEDLSADEEGREIADDVTERGGPLHQVVLVGKLTTGHRLEAAGVAQGRLILVVPADPAQTARIGRDQHRGRQHRIEVGLAHGSDPVLRLGADDLRDSHGATLPASAGYRYCPALTRSTCRPRSEERRVGKGWRARMVGGD